MTTPSTAPDTVTNHQDLLDLWTALLGPGGFHCRSVWLLPLDEQHRTLHAVIPVDEVPAGPDEGDAAAIERLCAEMLRHLDAGSCALLYSRPGPSALSDDDRAWGRALRDVAGGQPTVWPVHIATRGRIRVLTPDDLM